MHACIIIFLSTYRIIGDYVSREFTEVPQKRPPIHSASRSFVSWLQHQRKVPVLIKKQTKKRINDLLSLCFHYFSRSTLSRRRQPAKATQRQRNRQAGKRSGVVVCIWRRGVPDALQRAASTALAKAAGLFLMRCNAPV